MRFGEAESIVAPLWAASGTSLQAIDAHLAHLWVDPTPPGADPVVTETGHGHARASVLNLIVTVPDDDAAGRVVETMLGLGYRHPSRAIVLVVEPDSDGPTMDAAISAHCHAKPGQADEVCYEEVVLTVRGEAAHHLDGMVAPLLIHDLPTHIWWPGDPPFSDPVFDQLVELGDRLVVDTSEFDQLLTGMRRLAGLRRRSGVGDLTWERLGWWQELTAQFFDAPRFRRYLPNLNRLVVRYAVPPAGAPERSPAVDSPIAGALLYAGWIATRLTWRRHATAQPLDEGSLRLTLEGRHEMVDLQIAPVMTDAVPPGELVGVRLRAYGETGAAEFIIDRAGDEATVASNADGMTALLRKVTMEPQAESELLSATLMADRHDPTYEAALRAAAIFLDAARAGEAVA
jgi:glucose-6-phosphate dehydrogenase assembly protein OpcA